MGGHVFKNSENVCIAQSINKNEVFKIYSEINEKFLAPLNFNTNRLTGSAGIKDVSNDIDIVIEVPEKFKKYSTDYNELKKRTYDYIKENVDDLETNVVDIKIVGSIIALLWKYKDNDVTKYVQIDLVPSNNARDTAWITDYSESSRVSSLHKNLFISYYIKKLNDFCDEFGCGVKYSFSAPMGLRFKYNSTNEIKLAHSIENVYKVLGITKYLNPKNPETSFEFIADKTVEQNKNHKTAINLTFEEFKVYVQNYLDNAKYSQETKEALNIFEKICKKHNIS